MIEVRVGYDNIVNNGSAQWCTFYIEDDFNSFLDYDGEKYYKNQLAEVIYNKRVQKMREHFVNHFKEVNSIDDIHNVLIGVLYIKDYENGYEWW